MKSRISPEIELVFEQLLWIERRRFRIVENVSAHFGKALVERALGTEELPPSPLEGEPEFSDLLDEREPARFLRALAQQMEEHEAATVTRLRSHVTVYRKHVDEQILFGARTSGQEAGRSFLSRTPGPRPHSAPLSVPESVQAVFELNFTGLPGDRNHFLMLRPQGGATVHFVRSAHAEAWKAAAGDPRFLYELRCEWVRGILDIVSPGVELSVPQALEHGNPFGLEHYFLRGQHAGA